MEAVEGMIMELMIVGVDSNLGEAPEVVEAGSIVVLLCLPQYLQKCALLPTTCLLLIAHIESAWSMMIYFAVGRFFHHHPASTKVAQEVQLGENLC